MLSWDLSAFSVHDITQAHPCDINQGVNYSSQSVGKQKRPARMYVNDALFAAFSRLSMEKLLAAIIEAISPIMGDSCPTIHQCALAMNKWKELVVSPRQTILGLVFDTSNLTVFPTPEFIQVDRILLDKT